MPTLYSFVTQKSRRTTLELLQTATNEAATAASSAGVTFKILKGSFSANNKFYLDFGEKAPFHFFKCYPVAKDAKLVDEKGVDETDNVSADYVHPPVWGLCEVVQSQVEGVPVGTVYRGMLPLGSQVSFEKAHVEPSLENLVIHRPTTNPAYNAFWPIPADSVCHPSSPHYGLSLACFPGIVTGFGLYFALEHADYYEGCDTLVLTSASSKVALALALYLKHNKAGKTVIGYTSDSNRSFVEATGLYDQVLGYDEAVPSEGVIMVDISGKGSLYAENRDKVSKLLAVGNASASPDQDSTFASFSTYASIKMMLTMMGGPSWISDYMNPTQEVFLIMNTVKVLLEKWGKEKYIETVEEYNKIFCEAAVGWGMKVKLCEEEQSIQSAFEEMVQGTVPPTQCLVLDVSKAVEHRATKE